MNIYTVLEILILTFIAILATLMLDGIFQKCYTGTTSLRGFCLVIGVTIVVNSMFPHSMMLEKFVVDVSNMLRHQLVCQTELTTRLWRRYTTVLTYMFNVPIPKDLDCLK